MGIVNFIRCFATVALSVTALNTVRMKFSLAGSIALSAIQLFIFKDIFGGRTRTRTWDPLIKSQLLYQLSYAPGSPMRARPANAVV